MATSRQRKPLPQSSRLRRLAPHFLRCGTALAQDKNVTEDQIVRALAPEEAADPRPFYRSADRRRPGSNRRRRQVRPEDPRSLTRSLSSAERLRAHRLHHRHRRSIWRSTSTTTRPISARSRCRRFRRSAARSPTTISRLDLRLWPTDAAGRAPITGPLRAPRRRDQAPFVDKYGINGTDLVTSSTSREQARRIRASRCGSEPPRPGRQHGKQGHGV